MDARVPKRQGDGFWLQNSDNVDGKKMNTNSGPQWMSMAQAQVAGAGSGGFPSPIMFPDQMVMFDATSSADSSPTHSFSPRARPYASTQDKKASQRRKGKKSDSSRCGGRWTKEEDQKLRIAVEEMGPRNWTIIAERYFGSRRMEEHCKTRWETVLKPGLVKGPWTPEEDDKILECMRLGMTKWAEIAEQIPGRIGKQCRERWQNHLDPALKKSPWSIEEDAILIEAQRKWGNSWTKIARVLPGRSENQVKNRWHAASRRQPSELQPTPSPEVIEYLNRTKTFIELEQMIDDIERYPRAIAHDRGSVTSQGSSAVDIDVDEARTIVALAKQRVLRRGLDSSHIERGADVPYIPSLPSERIIGSNFLLPRSLESWTAQRLAPQTQEQMTYDALMPELIQTRVNTVHMLRGRLEPVLSPTSPAMSSSSAGTPRSQPSSPGDSGSNSPYEDDSEVARPFRVLALDQNELWRSRIVNQRMNLPNAEGFHRARSAQMHAEYNAALQRNQEMASHVPQRRLSDTHMPPFVSYTPNFMEPPNEGWGRMMLPGTDMSSGLSRQRATSPVLNFQFAQPGFRQAAHVNSQSNGMHPGFANEPAAYGHRGQHYSSEEEVDAFAFRNAQARANDFAISEEQDYHISREASQQNEASSPNTPQFPLWGVPYGNYPTADLPGLAHVTQPGGHHEEQQSESNFEEMLGGMCTLPMEETAVEGGQFAGWDGDPARRANLSSVSSTAAYEHQSSGHLFSEASQFWSHDSQDYETFEL